MSVSEFYVDQRSGDVTIEYPTGPVDTFSMSNVLRVGSSGVADTASRKFLADSGLPTKSPNAFSQVATRSRVPGNRSGSVFQLASKSYHHARDTITSLKVGIPNWYVVSGVETGIGGDATVQASIEYPAGTVIGRFTFSGSFTGTVKDLQTILSDELTLGTTIPNNAKFWVSIYYANAAGIPFVYTDGVGADTANGDVAQYGVSGVPNVTATGAALTNTTLSVGFYPVVIASKTKVRSFGIHGDSISAGKNDTTTDNTGFGGFAERAIGPTFPFINVANAGASVNSFIATTGFLRRQLLSFTSAVIFEAGINDISGAMPAATIADFWDRARRAFPLKDFYITTMCPFTTGAWTLTNGSDQTVTGNEAYRRDANSMLTGFPGVFTGVLDIESSVKHATVAGKWKPGYSDDGVHPSAVAYQAIAAGISPVTLLNV